MLTARSSSGSSSISGGGAVGGSGARAAATPSTVGEAAPRSSSKRAASASGAGSSRAQEKFLDRVDSDARRLLADRAEAAQRAQYAARADKKVCAMCGREQTFEQYTKKIGQCQQSGCRGARFKPKFVWNEVATSFLERLDRKAHERELSLARIRRVRCV